MSSLSLRAAKVLGMADIDVLDALQSEQFDFESGESISDCGLPNTKSGVAGATVNISQHQSTYSQHTVNIQSTSQSTSSNSKQILLFSCITSSPERLGALP